MYRIVKNVLFGAIFGIILAIPAFGWDDVGHKITGYIAWQRMSPQARENVIRILRSAPEDSTLAVFYQPYGAEPDDVRKLEYFIMVPTWGDIVRDFGGERAFRNEVRFRKYHRSNWHYDDIFWKQVDGKIETLTGFPEGGVGVTKLKEFDAVLRDPSTRDPEKAIAIAWLLHIGGDLHQPLHTSGRVTEREPKGDQGGNLFRLTPEGTPRDQQVNLHWYWDSIVGRNVPIKSGMCEREYIEMLGKRMMKRHSFASVQAKLNLGKYDDWQQESFAYNNTVVFSPDLKRGQMPSAKYKKNAFKLAEQQLAMAGYRLGETLNAVFDVPPPSAPGGRR
ncbi:MAG: S1/P1 nuclease [Pyrinomonadaceae bacterium]